jgi:hypothetical protein
MDGRVGDDRVPEPGLDLGRPTGGEGAAVQAQPGRPARALGGLGRGGGGEGQEEEAEARAAPEAGPEGRGSARVEPTEPGSALGRVRQR